MSSRIQINGPGLVAYYPIYRECQIYSAYVPDALVHHLVQCDLRLLRLSGACAVYAHGDKRVAHTMRIPALRAECIRARVLIFD